MHNDSILAALNLRHPGARVEPGELVRVRMKYPDENLPRDVLERIELASRVLARAEDAFSILHLLNHLSAMQIRLATPENRKLGAEWNATNHRLMDALSRRDSERYMEINDLLWGRTPKA